MSAKMLTPTPAAKVVSATGAAGVAGALMTVLLWGAGEIWPAHPIPVAVQVALLLLVTASCTYLAGYFTPPSPRDMIVPDPPVPAK